MYKYGRGAGCQTTNMQPNNMHKFLISLLIGCVVVAFCQSSPLGIEEGSVQKQHQQAASKDLLSQAADNGYKADGSFGVTFDNHQKEHRDRGYGYEKAYAYSRETAFFDFYDDKGALNAKHLVETSGGSAHEDTNEDGILQP